MPPGGLECPELQTVLVVGRKVWGQNLTVLTLHKV